MNEHETGAPTPKRPKHVKSWTFSERYPVAGGKKIVVRYPTAPEEEAFLGVCEDPKSDGAAISEATVDLARNLIFEFDGKVLKDDERDGVWADELDSHARSVLRRWVTSAITPCEDPETERLPFQ